MKELNKTLFIAGLLLPFTVTVNTVRAQDENKIETITEINVEQRIVEIEPEVKTPRPQNNVNVNDKSSVEMIVGGQSQDGVAKSINLPIDAK